MMKFSGISSCQFQDWETVSSVLYKAFYQDDALRSIKRFKEEEFPGFFSLSAKFFMKSRSFYSWIYWDNGTPAGALLAIPYNWKVSLTYLVSFFRELWNLIKWRAFSSAWTILKSAWFSRPRKPCLRVIFLGVIPEFRGRGLGKALLEAAEKASPFNRLQLEVEKENLSAISLYQKFGFRKEREFVLDQVPFFVMIKDLSQEKEPY
jgi:GNAT superfamily N-acetyltransferase